MTITGTLQFHAPTRGAFGVAVAAWVGYMRAHGFNVDGVVAEWVV